MFDRSEFACNGVYKCENFLQHFEDRQFSKFPIGRAGGCQWFIKLQGDYERQRVHPFLCSSNIHQRFHPFIWDRPALKVRFFMRFIKKVGSTGRSTVSDIVLLPNKDMRGVSISIQDILNEEYGYLDANGALTVEVGLHIEAILTKDGIRSFNFHDKFLNWRTNKDMASCKYRNVYSKEKRMFYCHKQLLMFHSSDKKTFFNTFTTECVHSRSAQLEKCFQLAHGVQIQLNSEGECMELLEVAQHYGLNNVIHHIQYTGDVLWEAVLKFNLTHSLANILRRGIILGIVIKKIHIDRHIDKLSGGMMKMMVAKIFEERG